MVTGAGTSAGTGFVTGDGRCDSAALAKVVHQLPQRHSLKTPSTSTQYLYIPTSAAGPVPRAQQPGGHVRVLQSAGAPGLPGQPAHHGLGTHTGRLVLR